MVLEQKKTPENPPKSPPQEAQMPQSGSHERTKIEYEATIAELTNTLKRLQAEFENSQKRNQKINAEFKEFATAGLLEQLLPVLDTLEQGMKHTKELVIVHEQLAVILKKNGLEKITIKEGNGFDHDKMECLLQEESDTVAKGNVVKVLLEGYTLHNKILRLAKVSVSAGKKSMNGTGTAPQTKSNEEVKK